MGETDVMKGRLLSGEAYFHASRPQLEGFNDVVLPDDDTAYLECYFAHCLPSISFYGTALWPEVLARCYHNSRHKPINLMHQMKVYDPEKRKPDRVIGTILSANMKHEQRKELQEDPADAHRIHALGCLFKKAHGVDRLMGQHLGGRHKWTVSMEINYWLPESGFLVTDPDVHPEGTPDILRRAGYSYIPMDDADDKLFATYDRENMRMATPRHGGGGFAGKWKGKDTYLLMSGLHGKASFSGLGIVQYGAQREAEIAQMLAGLDGDEEAMHGISPSDMESFLSAMEKLVDAVGVM